MNLVQICKVYTKKLSHTKAETKSSKNKNFLIN